MHHKASKVLILMYHASCVCVSTRTRIGGFCLLANLADLYYNLRHEDEHRESNGEIGSNCQELSSALESAIACRLFVVVARKKSSSMGRWRWPSRTAYGISFFDSLELVYLTPLNLIIRAGLYAVIFLAKISLDA